VEAVGAATALVAWAHHGFTGAAAAELAFAAALIALAFIDLDTWLLPNAITWPLIAFGLVMGELGVTPGGSLRSACYGAGLGFGAFSLFAWLGEKAFRKEALGFGDVWLLAGLGAWMGPAALLPVVLLASLQGTIVGLALIALGKGEPGPEQKPTPVPGSVPALQREGEAAVGTSTSTQPPSPIVSPLLGASETEPLTRTQPPDVRTTDDDWVPPKHAVPFGPFLVAGALEWLWLGGFLARAIPVLRLFH
jgi:leader peptidase (prepilin peptidase)/N-methyltransferase